MRRFLLVLISLIFVSSVFFTGCGEADRDAELKGFLKSNKSLLEDTFTEEACDYSLFSDYIKSWAGGSDIKVVHSGKHCTVLLNPATKGYEKKPVTALVCSVNVSDIQSDLTVIATATTALMGPAEHGPIRLILTESRDGRDIGLHKVPSIYYRADNLIDLKASGSDTILTSGADAAACSFTTSRSTKDTIYTEAYEITMSMSQYTDPYNFAKEKNYPNPINVIGSLLATEKSSSKLFDIASFSCERHEGYAPYSATATVVIDSNNVEGFMKKFDNSYENVSDRFDKLNDDFVYSITKVDMPKNVLDDKITNNLISLMYTLNTGICIQDEDTGLVYATSYIDSISTRGGRLSMNINVRARGENNMRDLTDEYGVTAGLCSTDFKCTDLGKVWKSSEGSALADFFSAQVPLAEDESNISLKTYDNDYIAGVEPKQNMIIYTFQNKNYLQTVLNISHFIDPNYEK